MLAGDTVAFYAYGNSNIKTLTGWDVEVTDLVTTLTKPTTTTASATINGTSVAVVSGHGIMDDVSTVRGVNISSSVANPLVTNISSNTLTIDPVQTLQNGQTLFFDGASSVVTLTGKIEIKNISNGATTIFFDLDKFLTCA